MLPEPLDMLIAFKMIALDQRLSSSDKRVAVAIVDSFNRKSGQCDPSLDRIAHLLVVSRRTVIRSVRRIERLRIIGKLRHGGKFNRNSYAPNWIEFRAAEVRWSARKRTRHWEHSGQNVSPATCQSCLDGGGKSVSQTSTINNLPSTSRRPLSVSTETVPHPTEARKQVTYNSAERRWVTALDEQFRDSPIYAKILDSITAELCAKATQAEMRTRGAGLQLIKNSLNLSN